MHINLHSQHVYVALFYDHHQKELSQHFCEWYYVFLLIKSNNAKICRKVFTFKPLTKDLVY